MKDQNNIRLFKCILTIILLIFLAVACKKADDVPIPINDEEPVTGNDQELLLDILGLVTAADELSMLREVMESADSNLLDILAGADQKTLLAPSNQAFSNLLGQLEDYTSLNDFGDKEEKELLVEILKYHVVGGKRLSNTLSDGTSLTTLQSESLQVQVNADVFIADKSGDLAQVINADNEASNGVVHIVDKVLLPDAVLQVLFPKPTLAELITETAGLTGLENALETAGLLPMFEQQEPFTLFAPSDAAIEDLFALLGEEYASFDDFDNYLELQILEQILLYHVISSEILSSEFAEGSLMTQLDGNTIEVIAKGETFEIGDASDTNARLLEMDKQATNGVVHIIDKILIPQELIDLIIEEGTTSGS